MQILHATHLGNKPIVGKRLQSVLKYFWLGKLWKLLCWASNVLECLMVCSILSWTFVESPFFPCLPLPTPSATKKVSIHPQYCRLCWWQSLIAFSATHLLFYSLDNNRFPASKIVYLRNPDSLQKFYGTLGSCIVMKRDTT